MSKRFDIRRVNRGGGFAFLLLAASLFSLCPPSPSRAGARNGAAYSAKALFAEFQPLVFQVRVIDNSSGKKSSIGSGFAVGESGGEGLIATNYHVIADAVLEPGRYRLEYFASDGSTGPLRVADIDVVHDLAVIATRTPPSGFFTLRDRIAQKGDRIFSMGNPLDLGMTIIEGTCSGLVEESLYDKIHFSGALNPGMSGGPAFDSSGEVLGVNVSTAGNEVSFLVPAASLLALVETVEKRRPRDTVPFFRRTEQELFDNQERFMDRLLGGEWKRDTLGDCLVPAAMGGFLRCWGGTSHDTDQLYTSTYITCSSSDDLYLTPYMSTGAIDIDFRWYEGDRLGRSRFYRLLQNHFDEMDEPNAGARNDLDEPRVITRFVAIGGARWKTTLCTWRYKKYPRLHDAVLKMALIDKPTRSMLVDVTISGVGREKLLAFCTKFMGALRCLR